MRCFIVPQGTLIYRAALRSTAYGSIIAWLNQRHHGYISEHVFMLKTIFELCHTFQIPSHWFITSLLHFEMNLKGNSIPFRLQNKHKFFSMRSQVHFAIWGWNGSEISRLTCCTACQDIARLSDEYGSIVWCSGNTVQRFIPPCVITKVPENIKHAARHSSPQHGIVLYINISCFISSLRSIVNWHTCHSFVHICCTWKWPSCHMFHFYLVCKS